MRYVNAAQAARILGIGDKTIRRWLKEGKKLPGAIVKATGEYAIPESEVEELRQLRLKYTKDETASHDQSGFDTLAAKVAQLEQEVATLKQGHAAVSEQAIERPISTSESDTISNTAKRAYTTSEDISTDWILCSDFFERHGVKETTYRRWLREGLRDETFEFEERVRPGKADKFRYFTPAQQERALAILSRHGKLTGSRSKRKSKVFLPEGCILVSTFARDHGIEYADIQHQTLIGLGGHGLVEDKDQLEVTRHVKGNYLTPAQQTNALQYWRKHSVPFTMPDTEQKAAADERPWYAPE